MEPDDAIADAIGQVSNTGHPVTWLAPVAGSPGQLPPCPYRLMGPEGMHCEAAEGAAISPDDCLRCTIPEALHHPKACLYLLPVRLGDEPTFVCRAYSSKVHALASRNWLDFCFCSYWFPRGDPSPENEATIPGLAAARQRYRVILTTPRRPESPIPTQEATREPAPDGWRLRWWRSLERFRTFWLWH